MPSYLDRTLLDPCPTGNSKYLNLIRPPRPEYLCIWPNNNCMRLSFVFKFQIQGHTEKEFQAAIWLGEMNMSYGRGIINLIAMGGWW